MFAIFIRADPFPFQLRHRVGDTETGRHAKNLLYPLSTFADPCYFFVCRVSLFFFCFIEDNRYSHVIVLVVRRNSRNVSIKQYIFRNRWERSPIRRIARITGEIMLS